LKRLFLLLIALALAAGCQRAATRPTAKSASSQPGRGDRGTALLGAAAGQLNDLPSFINTELRQPIVILDSRKSTDGKDVVAVCTSGSTDPEAPINQLIVQSGNSRFRSMRTPVKPGDIVKLYVKEDETIDEAKRAELRASGLERLLPVDLVVAQVVEDHGLFIAGQLEEPALANKLGKIEIWRYTDDRLIEISDKLRIYTRTRLPQLGWEPSPDEAALKQLVDRFNQWSRQATASTDWRLEPLLESVDSSLRNDEQLAPHLKPAALGAAEFEPHEGRLLQEAIWLRDLSRWVTASKLDDLGRATALFDWVVRNIQLETDEDASARRPWQILIHGRGSADQRAWVFALLCRQQGLDVVVLTQAGGETEFSLSAAMIDGQLHVFDTRLGLPLPGSNRQGVATLEQLRTSDALLRQFDLSDSPYPLSSGVFQQVRANIVADPFDLSRAAFQLERKLSSDNRVVLSTNPSRLAEQLKSVAGIDKVQLWDAPFRILRDQLNMGIRARRNAALEFEPFGWRPLLWKARVLQLHGRRRGDGDSAKLAADAPLDDHREATKDFQSEDVRPAPRVLAATPADKRRVDEASKLNATYWLGLLLFDDGNYEIALQWLKQPELTAADSPWRNGAHYNLGRTMEALGRLDEAAAYYEQDESPQRHGSRLRAKWLKSNPPSAEK
jgi:hypothetical protein